MLRKSIHNYFNVTSNSVKYKYKLYNIYRGMAGEALMREMCTGRHNSRGQEGDIPEGGQ